MGRTQRSPSAHPPRKQLPRTSAVHCPLFIATLALRGPEAARKGPNEATFALPVGAVPCTRDKQGPEMAWMAITQPSHSLNGQH